MMKDEDEITIIVEITIMIDKYHSRRENNSNDLKKYEDLTNC